jgi:hypothetical protein
MNAIQHPPNVAHQHLELDEDLFRAHFDRYPFKVKHHLVDHPLLSLPRLVRLAGQMKTPLYFRGDHSINQVTDADGEKAQNFTDRQLPRPELSPEETLEQIETANAWMQLRDAGAYPEYSTLLAELIEQLRAPSELVAPGLDYPRMDIFVSSPGATTPFHLDEEHNFLMQIRGSKRLSIANGFDPQAVDPQTLRDFFLKNGELARYHEHLEHHSVHVDLGPGEGVHIPPCHPHWVKNGDAVSISLGLLWYSDVTARRRHLFRIHHWLERVGMPKANPGDWPLADALFALPVSVKRRVRRAVRRIAS